MPTEHEYKYVISMDFAGFEGQLKERAREIQHIKQGYVAFSKGMTCRVRHIAKEGKDKEKWYFTFKQKITDRVVEIEKKISKRDGHDIWEICVGKLKKTRYLLDHKGVTWEIDFFRKGQLLYFIQAEVELDEGQPRPSEIHPLLKEFVLYEVPVESDKFSNKRLGDVEYARKIYSRLLSHRENTDDYSENQKEEGL